MAKKRKVEPMTAAPEAPQAKTHPEMGKVRDGFLVQSDGEVHWEQRGSFLGSDAEYEVAADALYKRRRDAGLTDSMEEQEWARRKAPKYNSMVRLSSEFVAELKRAAGYHNMSFGEYADAHLLPLVKALLIQKMVADLEKSTTPAALELVDRLKTFGLGPAAESPNDVGPRKSVRMLETRNISGTLRHEGDVIELNEVQADSLVKYGRAEYAD